MKLYVKWMHSAYSGGVPALFDEHGQLMPGQRACSVSSAVGDPVLVTVSFVVDGKNVIIEPQIDPNAQR